MPKQIPSSAKWFLLLSLVFHHLGTELLQLVTNSIPYEVAGYFNQPVALINYVYIATNIANLVASLIFTIILEYYGPTCLLFLANITAIFIIFLRLVAFYVNIELGFVLFVISQFSLAIEMIASSAIPLMLISVWFPTEIRTTAQAINSLGDVLSLLLSMLLGPLFIDEEKNLQQDFMHLMMTCSSFILIAVIFSIIFFVQSGWTCLPKDNYLTNSAREISEQYHQRFYGQGFSKKLSLFANYSCVVLRNMWYCMTQWRSFGLLTLEFSISFSLVSMVENKFFIRLRVTSG